MKLVLELLAKELERQNLLILANKMEKKKRTDLGHEYKGPPIYGSLPTMIQLRDEIEEAIAYLKAKSPK